MLSVIRVHLPSEIPIVGCELAPYVLLRRPDSSITTDDVPESAPLDGYYLRYKWYRIQSDKKVAICSVHPTEQATLQCLGCLKAKIPIAKSYHCSSKCFSDAWHHHRILHERAASAIIENGTEEEELISRYSSSASGVTNTSLPGSTSGINNGSVSLYPATGTERSGGETWFEVGRSKTYTPAADDIGHTLRFECVVVDAETKLTVGGGSNSSTLTQRVIPAPTPSPRRLIPVSGVDVAGLDLDGRTAASGTFTVLSYNILSEAYASNELYGYCPSWALSWHYRRQNLLREIVGYRADILCLQEVQSDHFEEFFGPELEKHGYQALYKKKTSEVYSGNAYVDGCATFFRRDRFSHVKKYEVEFNKAAQSLTEQLIPNAQKKTALNRLLKDNVALIAVLEAKFSNHGADTPGKKQLLCVANTHVNVHQDLKDVKLWQVHTLLKGLEKIAVSADIPMLVCGDFNSIPGSAPHALLAMGKVDQMHPDLLIDPLNILRPTSKLTHQLPLVSAYSSFARMGVGIGLEQQRRKMDPSTNEPLFTNCTRDFIGTHDYIFYTADSLTVDSLLELLDEEGLRKDTALPSPEWSSDHIALLAEFRCKPKTRR
ncbi:hypothetical protein GIB67_016901 [Kingdonia uniflora]|uniref:poly(A)-specific ribonuclease n=1 Tax=Kingdonia uniflora TaxID=39325 RepID=A0A7J7M3A5_9MAGN|nr:hypothetical protein GIB67_016901 [Kingdonia uniflora]